MVGPAQLLGKRLFQHQVPHGTPDPPGQCSASFKVNSPSRPAGSFLGLFAATCCGMERLVTKLILNKLQIMIDQINNYDKVSSNESLNECIMRTRNGKIARMSQAVREELNLRLERSEPSPQLLAWLNALPEVREFLQKEYDGEPVSKQNLSRWHLGGYQDWLTRRDFFDDTQIASEFVQEHKLEGPDHAPANHAATVLAARLGGLLMRWDGECTPEFEAKSRVLNGLCRSVVELQRKGIRSRNPGQSRSVTVSHGHKIVGKGC